MNKRAVSASNSAAGFTRTYTQANIRLSISVSMETIITRFFSLFIFFSLWFCRFGDERGYILYPQIGNRLDLVCPATSPPGPNSPPEYEYYKLYLVSSREQADRCEVMGAPNLLLTCDKPNSDMRFTIKFQEYSPNLWGHEFKNLQDYYIIGEWTFGTTAHTTVWITAHTIVWTKVPPSNKHVYLFKKLK